VGYWQREYLRENTSMSLGETWREDLPDDGLLGSLLLRMSVAGVSSAFDGVHKWRIIDYLPKVELIGNGSEVIMSLSAQELAAMMWFDQGIVSPDYWHSYATGTKWAHLLINFGRRLFDPEYGLDLSKWDSVELRITNDGSSTYFGEDIGLSVLQYFLRGAAGGSFRGYFRREQWRSWTTVQDETVYLEMPETLPIRRILMQLIPDLDSDNVAETAMHNLADDIELSLKTGSLRVFKGGIDDLMWENLFHVGKEALTSAHIYQAADKGRNVGLGYVLAAVGGAGSQSGSGASTIPTLEGRRTDFTQKAETYEADILIPTLCRGLAPENVVGFHFTTPDAPEGYLDPRANATVKLDVHTRNASSAADGTVNVVLDRLVPA